MKEMIIRMVSASIRFALNFIIWFVAPKFLVDMLHIGWFDITAVFYLALSISLLAGLSGFYRKRQAGIAFSMASDVAILTYVIYLSGGGVLSMEVMGFHAKVEFGNLLLILILPVIISLFGKAWKLATFEAEQRVEMVEKV